MHSAIWMRVWVSMKLDMMLDKNICTTVLCNTLEVSFGPPGNAANEGNRSLMEDTIWVYENILFLLHLFPACVRIQRNRKEKKT